MKIRELLVVICFSIIFSLFLSLWNYYFTQLNPDRYDYMHDLILFVLALLYFLFLMITKTGLLQRLIIVSMTFIFSLLLSWIVLISKFSYSSFNDPLGQLWFCLDFLFGIVNILIAFGLSVIIGKTIFLLIKKKSM